MVWNKPWFKNIKFLLHSKFRQNITFSINSYLYYSTFQTISQPLFDIFSKKSYCNFHFFQWFDVIFCRFDMRIVKNWHFYIPFLPLENLILLLINSIFPYGNQYFNGFIKKEPFFLLHKKDSFYKLFLLSN